MVRKHTSGIRTEVLGHDFSKHISKVRRESAGPLFGGDSAVLIAEIGYADHEIQGLIDRGVVKGPTTTAVHP